jgi:hypothetical protein
MKQVFALCWLAAALTIAHAHQELQPPVPLAIT